MSMYFFLFFILTGLLSLYYFLGWKRPSAYPPKYLLKKRLQITSLSSVIFFIIGIVLMVF